MKNPYKLNISRYSTHNIIKENIGRNNVVLDVGCNDGYLGKISDATNKFYGLDCFDECIQRAKERYENALSYDLNYLEKLPWGIKFDVIVFADVLEHVLYPKEVLNFFIKNYLKNGGRVIVSLPNIANWQVRLNLLFGKFDYMETGIMDKTHLHLYTFKSAKKLISNNDLKIVKEFGGASIFGPFIQMFIFLRGLLATNIVLVCENNKNL